MRSLDRLPTLKLRLGVVIVLAIVVTLATMLASARLGLALRWGALAGLVLSLAAVQLVARGMIAPLRAMARSSEEMAAGRRGQRVEVRSRDEVGQLARSFNRMAAELERSDDARRAMVADAAHELRTPIAVLRASLENAADGVQPVDVAALLAQAERLSRLADQLLDLSGLESGGTRLEPRRFLVAELLDGADPPLEAPAKLAAFGDPDRLRQVVANLVDNARRHAAGSAVHVRARARGEGGVVLEVEDRGPGLGPGEAERIFERFARGDRSRSTAGTGLGLAIVRSIVELHGGTIRAEPADPRGLRMVVELPG